MAEVGFASPAKPKHAGKMQQVEIVTFSAGIQGFWHL
jgi:hypothetical protein